MPKFFIFNGVMLNTVKPFHLSKLDKNRLINKEGQVQKCFICNGALTEDTTAVIGTILIHNHVRICEAVTYKTMRKNQELRELEEVKNDVKRRIF